MPDISMCDNKDCPSNKKCYRFTAIPSQGRQSYADFKPEKDKDKCEYFMEIWKKNQNLKKSS